MFYCQCYFYSPDTNVGYQVKLFNLVRPNDHPTFDYYGKTSLWIDDIQWSPSDLTCVIAFKAKSIAIITRLGSLVRFIVDPSTSVSETLPYKLSSSTRRFHELVYPRESMTIDPAQNTQKIKIMFEKDRFIVIDNRTFFVFSFSHIDDIMSLLSW